MKTKLLSAILLSAISLMGSPLETYKTYYNTEKPRFILDGPHIAVNMTEKEYLDSRAEYGERREGGKWTSQDFKNRDKMEEVKKFVLTVSRIENYKLIISPKSYLFLVRNRDYYSFIEPMTIYRDEIVASINTLLAESVSEMEKIRAEGVELRKEMGGVVNKESVFYSAYSAKLEQYFKIQKFVEDVKKYKVSVEKINTKDYNIYMDIPIIQKFEDSYLR